MSSNFFANREYSRLNLPPRLKNHPANYLTDFSTKHIFNKLLFLALTFLFFVYPQQDLLSQSINSAFKPSKALEGKVNFWKLAFTRFGKDQLIFHHRSYPEIIYSVLDFSEHPSKKDQEKLIEAETARIRTALQHLSKGNKPRNAFEKKIVKEFLIVNGTPAEKYGFAASEDQIRNQSGMRERFGEGLKRSGRYLYAIERIFYSAGLPTELARIPLIESSFDYTAYSSVGAAGIWQFMRKTAKSYMKVGPNIDERKDAIISSRAAAQYLFKAYKSLNNWPLAVTSYNHGVGGIYKGVKETGSSDLAVLIAEYKSDSFGFASQNFFPSFLAALEIERNQKKYFPNLLRDPPVKFDEIKITKPLSFKEFEKYSRVPKDELSELNRALLKPILTNRYTVPSGTLVKLPHGHGRNFIQTFKNASLVDSFSSEVINSTVSSEPEKTFYKPSNKVYEVKSKKGSLEIQEKLSSRYTVKKGDTAESIAKRFGVNLSDLLKINHLGSAKQIAIGTKLTIPGSIIYLKKEPSPKKSKTKSRTKSNKVRISTSKSTKVKSTNVKAYKAPPKKQVKKNTKSSNIRK